MRGAQDWLADDRRAKHVFWIVVVTSITGGIVSLASYKRQPLINDAALIVTVCSIAAGIVLRALAVRRLWVAVLGIGLEISTLVLHWHHIQTIDLLVPLCGPAILYILVFYVHRPRQVDDKDGTTAAVNATVPADAASVAPQSEPTRRPLPGDPHFTYRSPPR
jgi:hypothetical protein